MKMSKKIATALVAVMMVGLLAVGVVGCGGGGESSDGGSTSSGGDAAYTPGTYTGEGKGFSGTIEVTLTVDESSIVSVDEIVDPGESDGIGGKEAIADGTFVDQIMDAQSAEIDGVSGATQTSKGVIAATEDALAQAAA